MSQERINKIAAGATLTLAGSLLGGALTFLSEAGVARLFGPGIYGFYAVGIAVLRIGETLALYGLRAGTLHFLPVYRSRGDRPLVAGTIAASLALPAALGVAIAAACWGLAPLLAARFADGEGAVPYLRTISLAIPLSALAWMTSVVTWGYGHSRYQVAIRNLVPPGVFLAGLGAVYATAAGPPWMLRAFVAAQGAAAALGLFFVLRVAGPELRGVAPRFEFRELYAYSWPVFVSTLFYMALAWTDLLLLSVFSTPENVGIYRACMIPFVLMDMIPRAVNAPAASVYPVLHDQGRTQELSDAYGSTTRWLVAVSLLVAVVALSGRRDILGLLGPSFAAGAPALAILVIGQSLNSASGSAGFLLAVTGNQRLETINAAAAAAVSLSLNLYLIPRHGIVGAATGTATAFVVMNCLRIAEVRWKMGFSTYRAPCFRIAAVGLVTAGLVQTGAFAIGFGDGAGVPALALRTAALLVALGASLWYFGIEPEDREAIAGIARRVARQPGRVRPGAPT